MLYLLGGTARSGKSAAAKQFLAETGIPFFPLDCLMMGFARGLPELGVDPEDDELRVADLLWSVVKPMAVTFVEEGIDYLIEGVQVRPRHAWQLRQALPGQVRACFLGFAEADVEAKLSQIQRFGGGLDDWLRDYDDACLRHEVKRLKALSRRIRAECEEYDVPYVEVSTDLQDTVETVVAYLRGQSG
jgi:hypothetical protein